MKRWTIFALTIALTLCLAMELAAQSRRVRLTTIYVGDMHCANCANSIARKLYAVPGVVEVKTDLATATAVVTPQQQRNPSPRAMWEAVQEADFQPVKLVGPHGTFTSKPPY